MNTIFTNDFLNQKVWDNLVQVCGNNDERLKSHPLIDSNGLIGESYSQWGEDKVLNEILKRIGISNNVAVELGARDGISLSTTLALKNLHGMRRILIEARVMSTSLEEKIVHALITPENINDLLAKEDCPEKPDILSIDIDGDDYWVWKATEIKARIVLVEYHSAIPNDIPLAIIQGKGDVQSHLGSPVLNGYYSANLLAWYNLAKEKGYSFCVTLKDNAFFVLNEEFGKLGLPEISREECMRDYFQPEPYWWKHRDQYNREWVVLC